MSTKIINLFAGPGAGKSTVASGLFTLLKENQYEVEMAKEYAKQITWERRELALCCQPYVFGKQLMEIERLSGKVDIIISESPILLSAVYTDLNKYPISFVDSVVDIFNSMDNTNFFLNRKGINYNENGRNQTLEEALIIDAKIKSKLHILNIPYIDYPSMEAKNKIMEDIKCLF